MSPVFQVNNLLAFHYTLKTKKAPVYISVLYNPHSVNFENGTDLFQFLKEKSKQNNIL